jgi:SH3-like domain-containing protein
MTPLLLALAVASAPAPTAPPPGYAYTVASVYLRRTPSYPGPVIDELKIGTRVKVISCSAGWCELDLGPRAGVGYLTADAIQAAGS